jgi:hypothetical protein
MTTTDLSTNRRPQASHRPPRVVIVGGGFGGLRVALSDLHINQRFLKIA